MNREEIRRLLQKPIDELTLSEREKLAQWYDAIGTANSEESPFVDQTDEEDTRERLRRRILRRKFNWYPIAAAILLFAAVAWLFQKTNFRLKEQMVSPGIQYVEVSTAVGQLKNVRLADGSSVWLNGNSRLILPERFSDTLRVVTLEGEAFFEIERDTTRPFIVNAGELSTRVLGTSFNISAYPTVKEIAVTVATGRVAVNHGDALLGELTTDRQAVFNRSTSGYAIRNYNARHASGWRDGTIWLEGASFRDLSALFANTFGYTLETELTRLERVRFTASFRKQDKLTDILDMLSRIPGVNYRIEGRVITMY